MKITDVKAATIRREYADAPRNTHHVWSERRYVLVSVETDTGLSGLGEIYTDGHNSTDVLELTVARDVAPHLIGHDPRAIGALIASLEDRQTLSGRADGFGPILAGIDIALWDLFGKIVNQPLWRLLGGHSDRVRTYASGGMYGDAITPESLAREMAAAVAEGNNGIKIKAGAAPLAEDVARVAAIREAIGPDVPLMVDAMFAPTLGQAIRLARALVPFDLHFLEAPTAALDLAGWSRIRDAVGIPLAGPELQSSVKLMRDILERDVVQFLQYDVTLAGGLSRGRDLAAMARAHHRQVSLHCATSAVGLAASVHLGGAIPNCDGVEHHILHQGLHEHLWASGWKRSGGAIVAPDRPGLGIPLSLHDILAAEERA
ncbi:mandelate racemase/muconate lactonizing enzyme family protein [Jannaschia sp. LMIT008]|uniref:mandelate racemase/muconate lactonizing enzyme family protein n=1 Tax=Jannaschia maritima TaxID=3032585 RepID=UPI0028122698|nr:mandelate racemase/muconate lactonizing enzyme family protein [Jannaschia sp. LMIT008]